jgi:hypothetical protein
MSGDGHQVLFLVDMTIGGSNLGPWYVRNLQTQTTTHLVTSNLPLAFSPRYLDGQFLGDGRWIAFTRQQSTVSGPTARVLIIDRDSDQNGVFDEPGTITRKIIEPSQGAPFTRIQSASRSGRFFTYQAAAFGVPGSALWLHDRDPDGDGVLDQPSSVPDTLVTDSFLLDVGSARAHQVSDDGRFVAFADQVMLSSGSTRIARVKDMQTGGVFLQGATFSTGDAAPIFGTPTISTDGSSVVVAVGTALIAGDVNGQLDVYSIPHDETVCEPVLYYGGANGNSVNPFGSEIRLLGSIRISLDNFTLQAIDVPNGPGQFFYGPEEASTPFGDGFRFVGAGQLGLFRLPIVHGVGNLATFHMPFGVPPASAGPGHITPGSTWNFQYVFRDPSAGTFGFNTSSAVRVTFCP